MALKDGGIVILDYGSQTAQLIARRVRELRLRRPGALYPTLRRPGAPAFGMISPAARRVGRRATLLDWVAAAGARHLHGMVLTSG